MSFDAYKKEKAVLEHGDTLLASPEGVDFVDEYRVLHKSYGKLYKLLRRLVAISDRLEKHLKEANQTIEQQRRELASAHDDLSGRNAQLETKINEFESIFNNSAMGIALLASDGTVDRANSRLDEVLEASPGSLVGRRLTDFLLGEEDCRDDGVRLERPGPGEILRLECRVKTVTGRMFFAELSGKTLNPAQSESDVIWLVGDITSRKELEKVQADVQRIMQHDLKGPLNGIINLPGIVAQDGNLTPDQTEVLDSIASAGRKMLRQIELAHDIYKMETGCYQFIPRPVDMVAVVRSVLQEYKSLARQRGVQLLSLFGDRDMRPDDRLVGAAEELLSCMMLGNIVKNAIEASQSGESVRIVLDAGEAISLAVQSAKPVAPTILPVFFHKYATFGKPGGTGLGTYSASLMARTQGCGLAVASSETAGTQVTFTIPRY